MDEHIIKSIAKAIGDTPLSGGSLRGNLDAHLSVDYPTHEENVATANVVEAVLIAAAKAALGLTGIAAEMSETCGNCKFFSATMSKRSALRPEEGIGECRRYAPRGPVALGWAHGKEGESHAAIMSAFPFVPDDDWCGEFIGSQAYFKAVMP
jgi:hypothetical protein